VVLTLERDEVCTVQYPAAREGVIVGTPEGAAVDPLSTMVGVEPVTGVIDTWTYHMPLAAAFVQRQIVGELQESDFEPDDLTQDT
jgi:hypothetical protein